MQVLSEASPPALTGSGLIKVVLADDHPIVRAGVAGLLDADPAVRVVGEAETGQQAIELVKRFRPHVLVTDIRMPDMDGIEVCAHLKATHPTVRVVILTQFNHEAVMIRAFGAGAKGFVVKESNPDLIREAVRRVAEGHTFIDSAIASKVVNLATRGRRAKGPHDLTLQEMRVLELLPKGLSNREIANELGVSHETVKTHLRHVLRKLQVADRAEAAAVAIREGLA